MPTGAKKLKYFKLSHYQMGKTLSWCEQKETSMCEQKENNVLALLSERF